MAVTRSEMISELKSRGQRGKLSKMTKPQLATLLSKSAHGSERGKVQVGAGSREHSEYQVFVADQLKRNGGNMTKAAQQYSQRGSGHCGKSKSKCTCDKTKCKCVKADADQAGSGFFDDLVHGKMKSLGGDLSHDWKHGLGKVVEYGAAGLALASGPENWAEGISLLGEAGEAGEAAEAGEAGAEAGEAGEASMRTGQGEQDLTTSADDDGSLSLKDRAGRLGRNLKGNAKKAVGVTFGAEALKDGVFAPVLGSTNEDTPPPPDPGSAAAAAAAKAATAAAAKAKNTSSYFDNLSSLNQSNAQSFSNNSGINPWG